MVFTNFSDQALYLIDANNDYRKLTSNTTCRYADLEYDKKYERLICVREEHSGKNVEAINTIVAIYLSETKEEVVLVKGSDFYSNPRLSNDNEQLCWISWQHPNMPWDNTSLSLANLNDNGEL